MTQAAPEQRQQQPRRIPKADRAEKIKAVFVEQYKLLSRLFPSDGKTMLDRAISTALTVSNKLKDNVTAESIIEATVSCLHLGLEVGDQAYIYPFGTEAKLTVGPRGLIALAYRSGFVKSIVARAVFEADVEQGLFKYNLGDDSISHEKAMTGRRPMTAPDERGEVWHVAPEALITHAYCKIETTTEGRILEVLTAEDIEFYRHFSKATDGPWFDNYEGMCRKTAIKRGCEYVPREPMLVAALRENEDGTFKLPAEMAELVDKAIRARDKLPPKTEVVRQTMEEPEVAASGGAGASAAA